MRHVKTAVIITLPCLLLAFVLCVFIFFSPPPVQMAAVPEPEPEQIQTQPAAAAAVLQPETAVPSSSWLSGSLIASADRAERYIYEQLSPTQRIVYDRVRVTLERMDASMHISADEEKALAPFDILGIYNAVVCDYPEIFWSDNYIYTRTTTRAGNRYKNVEFAYTMTAAERDEAQKRIDAYTTACLSGIARDASDFDKILYVYEYIIRNTEYDLASEYNQEIASVFLNGRSVCKGYAKATQYLLHKLGIACSTISGNATGRGLHAWNLVRADGDYYYLDTTWGDPDLEQKSYASYDYFLVTAGDLAATHMPYTDYPLPECVATRLNYYNVKGRQFDQYDSGAIVRVMRADLRESGYSTVRFSSDAEYEKAVYDLFKNSAIAKATNSRISYFLTDELRIITVLNRETG
ncbi:MAG: hypothetical protein LBQ16_05500 [Gracilibacteraceae bacterium]|jgi:hypothetical protein|nr:hypothetical protein [Gracilibacteraceae bacterium]